MRTRKDKRMWWMFFWSRVKYNGFTILFFVFVIITIISWVIWKCRIDVFEKTLPAWLTCERIGLFFAGVTIIVTLWTFITEMKQKTLAKYNQRFMEDPTIRKVTSVLTRCEYLLDNPTYSSVLIKAYPRQILKPWEIELFYRFYEEMELGIERGILKSEDVRNLFSYYAQKGIETYNLLPKNEIDHDWILLGRFLKRMEKKK